MKSALLVLLVPLCFACGIQPQNLDNATVILNVVEVAPNTYRHLSFLETESFGKVGCNGMVVVEKGEAIIIDTPTNDEASHDLMHYVQNILKAKIKAVVVTHFHEDCLGGLKYFHERNIPSYSFHLTAALAEKNGVEVPRHHFKDSLRISVGMHDVELYHLGAGHTVDNTVVYYPTSKALFGGCLVKCLGAGKGNLVDARVEDWSQTIKKVQQKFPDVEHIIPGHGKDGGKELLEYTRALFAQ